MAKTNKYAYDRHYYERLYTQSFNGNAVRKLDSLQELEEDTDDELLDEEYEESDRYYDRRYERNTRAEEEVHNEPKVKIRRKAEINLFYTFVMVVSVVVLLASAFKMLETKSDITQTEKKISIAKTELADINALNESLKASLDTQVDRNYIYSVAVGRLGMVYPNNNRVVYYEPADGGYVRQLSQIP